MDLSPRAWGQCPFGGRAESGPSVDQNLGPELLAEPADPSQPRLWPAARPGPGQGSEEGSVGSARLSWLWEERVPGRERARVKATVSAHRPPQAWMAKPYVLGPGAATSRPQGSQDRWLGGRAGPEGAVCPRYSAEAQAMQRQCTCCQETRAHPQVVTMQCRDGTAVQHTYTHVDACGCAPSCAPSPAAAEDSSSVLLS